MTRFQQNRVSQCDQCHIIVDLLKKLNDNLQYIEQYQNGETILKDLAITQTVRNICTIIIESEENIRLELNYINS